jgi:hypothetical protein
MTELFVLWVLFCNSCWFEIELTFDTEYFITSVRAFPVWRTFVDLTRLTRDFKCISTHVTTVYFSVQFNLHSVGGLDESNDCMVWVTVVTVKVKLSVSTPRVQVGEPRHWSIHSKPRQYTRECSQLYAPRPVHPRRCFLVPIEQDTLCTPESVVFYPWATVWNKDQNSHFNSSCKMALLNVVVYCSVCYTACNA